jgi:ribonuclease-3
MNLILLQESLGVKFNNPELLSDALTHASFINENRGRTVDHNERLEWFGDSILEFLVREHLYLTVKQREGGLTELNRALVCDNTLSRIAQRLGIGGFITMSKGEKEAVGSSRDIILACAMEAIIAALYLDQGMNSARTFVQSHVITELPKILDSGGFADDKWKLHKLVQAKLKTTADYKIVNALGPEHAKTFVAQASIRNVLIGEGQGGSKKDAMIAAATNALQNKIWETLQEPQ